MESKDPSPIPVGPVPPQSRPQLVEQKVGRGRLSTTGKILLVIVVILVLIFVIAYAFKYLSAQILFGTVKSHTWKPPMPHQDIMEQGVHIWHFPKEGATKTVLFCHGSWGNISHREYLIDTVLGQGLNVTVFDYRGYGQSVGTPSVLGIQDDGVVAYRWLAARVPARSIILWGESLGGAVATYIASKYPADRLILWCTFSTLVDIAELGDYSLFMRLAGRCATAVLGDFPTSERLRSVTCPVMVAHSETDGLISINCAMRNYRAIAHPHKHFLEIGGTHSRPVLTTQMMATLMRFIDNGPGACTSYDPACRVAVDRFHDHVDRINRKRAAGHYNN